MLQYRIFRFIFDEKFKWNTHLKKLKSICKTRINVIKTLAHYTWEAIQNSLLNIYKSLILSRTQYVSIIYNIVNPNLLKIFDPIHNERIR